ncbi:MAG: hypothetical protein N3B18_09200 [Desulfobacterota bacterium]|nr:hypothetical protein [Thermodesulfobacteriota bacterium]
MRPRRVLLQSVVLCCLGILFWTGWFIIFYRVLAYFQRINFLGDFLAAKLLSMVMLTFFSMLLFSTIITAISSMFLSEELQLLISTPYDYDGLYEAKLWETMVNSSWMVLIFSLPVFFSYGIIYHQGISYYTMLTLSIPPLICICGALGSGIALILVKIFPARRLKDILFLLFLFTVVIIYLLFRLLRPERLVDPEVFITVIDYLTSLNMPAAPFLPSQWVTDCLLSFLFSRNKEPITFSLGLLWSTAGAFIVIFGWAFRRCYFDAWTRAQEARSAKITRSNVFMTILKKIFILLPCQIRGLVIKDICCFFRDTAQWSQLFILAGIIIIYLYNFSVLPIEKSPIPTRQLQNTIAFLNLGLAGFVLAAVAVRFGFPAISLEGEAFWIINASPLTLDKFIWCKFWMTFIMLSVLAQILIVCTNLLLHVDIYMMLLSCTTILLMTFGIASLSIGLGAAFPRFRYENIAQIPTGFGGLVYMITALSFIAIIVVIEALPVHIMITADMAHRSLTWQEYVGICMAGVSVLLISTIAFIVPMKMGIKQLTEKALA